MTRSWSIIGVFMAGSFTAPCQSTFIVEFDSVQNGFGGTGRSIFETEEGFLLFTDTRSDDGLLEGRCGTYLLDTQGEFMSRQIYENGQSYGCAFGFFDPVAPLDTGGFIGAFSRFHADPWLREIALGWFNEVGERVDSLTVLSYPVEDSVWLGSRQVRQTTDHGFIIGGFRDPRDTLAKALLLKTDSAGSVEWMRTYGSDNDIHEVLGVAEYVNHGFVAVGQHTSPSNASFLLRTDSLGNQLWRRQFGGDADVAGAVRVAADSNIITWSEYREQDWEDYFQQLMLTKWNANGDIIWQKRSHYQVSAVGGDFEVLPDGSLIASGRQGAFGALMKFTAEGDSLWTRYLEVFEFDNGADHGVYDVEPTSDGGFVLTGYAFQGWLDPHPNAQTIWVIKTDSLGCVVPGCQNVGVQEYVLDLQSLLRVSPNPASDLVNIAMDLPEGGEVQGQAQVQLLDAGGRLVLERGVQQNLNQLRATLDVSALPAGTYYLHLRDARRWLAGSKLVVE